MKRLSPIDRHRYARLAWQRWHRRLRRKSYVYVANRVHRIVFPEDFSFRTNHDGCTRALAEIREFAFDGRGQSMRIEIEMRGVKVASMAAILALTAECDRTMAFGAVTGVRVVAYRPYLWQPAVLGLLSDMNFFNLLGVQLSESALSGYKGEDLTFLPITFCHQFIPDRINRITQRLKDVAMARKQSPYIYEALLEAVHNTSRHAYPQPWPRVCPVVPGGWWATAAWSPANREIKLVVFDQGVGIPGTLPRWEHWEHVRGWLASHLPVGSHLLNDHSYMIEAALEVSRTRKGAGSGRGQGLTDVISPIEELGVGRLRILSGKGCILYQPGRVIERIEYRNDLEGTLIEWIIPVQDGAAK